MLRRMLPYLHAVAHMQVCAWQAFAATYDRKVSLFPELGSETFEAIRSRATRTLADSQKQTVGSCLQPLVQMKLKVLLSLEI